MIIKDAHCVKRLHDDACAMLCDDACCDLLLVDAVVSSRIKYLVPLPYVPIVHSPMNNNRRPDIQEAPAFFLRQNQ